MTIQRELVQAADEVLAAATELEKWIVAPENLATLAEHGETAATLVHAARREHLRARNLRNAALGKMTVGIFGPSQVGKSYLASRLAPNIRIGGKSLNFVQELNPRGGDESTVLITRFTTEPVRTSDGLPIRVRLLSQADLVKIIGNSFFLDFDANAECREVLESKVIESRLDELEALALGRSGDSLNALDIFEIEDYFFEKFRAQTSHLARSGFWQRANDLAPRLASDRRARLWSLIWSDYKPFTDLWLELQAGIEALGFAPEANLPTEALLPRESSIIDATILDRLGADGGDLLSIQAVREDEPVGEQTKLPRSLVCALTAELMAPVGDGGDPLLQRVDLLDFPGARSRKQIKNPDDLRQEKGFRTGANPMRELLLRGKVGYAIHRYTARRAFSALIVGVQDGPQEVRSLSEDIATWIAQTIGSTPEARRKQKKALLLVLTKMDNNLVAKAGDTEKTLAASWTTRLKASLLNNFTGTWSGNWDGRPFNNVFWLRNPEYLGFNGVTRDADNAEAAFTADFAKLLPRLKNSFIANEDVRQHFASPKAAWDAALTLKDGGVSYIVANLDPLCNLQTKIDQDRQSLEEIRRELQHMAERFHLSDDLDERIQKRLEAAGEVIDQLYLESAKLGLLLRGLQVDAVALNEHLSRIGRPGASAAPGVEKGSTSPAAQPPAAAPARRDLARPGAAPRAIPPQPAAAAPSEVKAINSPWAEIAAAAATAFWGTAMKNTIENDRFEQRVGISKEAMRKIREELLEAGQRTGLAQQIARELDKVLFEDKDGGVEKAAIVCQHLINRFVSELGVDRRSEAERPRNEQTMKPVFAARQPLHNIDGWPAEPPDYEPEYLTSWTYAYHAMVAGNAEVVGEAKINVVQNRRLGEIRKVLSRPLLTDAGDAT